MRLTDYLGNSFFKSKKEQKEQEEQIRIFNAEATIQAFFTEKQRKAVGKSSLMLQAKKQRAT